MNDCRHGHHPEPQPSLFQRVRKIARPVVALTAAPGVLAALGLYLDRLDNPKAVEELGHRVMEFIEDLKSMGHSNSVACEDCGMWGYGYMLKNATWEKVLTDEEREEIHYGTKKSAIICLACAQKRLGRPLTPDDFDLKYSINWPILCAMQIARTEGTEEGADLEALRSDWAAKREDEQEPASA